MLKGSVILPQERNVLSNHIMSYYIRVTLSYLQTNTDTFANSEGPDVTAHTEPSHLDLPCLPFYYCFLTKTPIFNNGCVQIQRWNNSFQKPRGERVKYQTQLCIFTMNTCKYVSKLSRVTSVCLCVCVCVGFLHCKTYLFHTIVPYCFIEDFVQ